jgi:RNA polymerase sigma-70 factor (ECF subfamily)
MKTDVELLAAARAGDRAALEALLARHQPRIFRFGMRMCREEESAKDVLQETLLAAARGIRDFRGGAAVSTWLYTIARSFCIKARRASKFAPEHVDSLDRAPEAAQVPDARRGPEEDVAGRQVEDALSAAIGGLEPMYREALVLRDVEGLSAPEVAQILGISVEAVKSRLHRARLAVRERVAPHLGIAAAAAAAPARGPACPDVLELLSRKLEGEIHSELCVELERHVQGCDGCRARCDSLKASLALCSRAGEEPVPPRVERAVREALRKVLDDAGAG